jgi:nitrogen regulatory protein P-II 1
MKKIDAIIRTEKLPEVREALKAVGIGGMTVFSVTGWSRGKEESLQWKGQPVIHDLIAKSKIEIVVSDDKVNLVLDTICNSARTGAHGDGILYVLPVEQAVSILTMDRGDNVIK